MKNKKAPRCLFIIQSKHVANTMPSVYWYGCGWTSKISDAAKMNEKEAMETVDRMILDNKEGDGVLVVKIKNYKNPEIIGLGL